MIIQKRSVLLYHSYYSLEKKNKTNAVLTIIASFNLIAKDVIQKDGIHNSSLGLTLLYHP